MTLSVRQLKAELTARGVDFLACREKHELVQLLQENSATTVNQSLESKEFECLDGMPMRRVNPSTKRNYPFCEGGFAMRRFDKKCCWVEFVTDGEALCTWPDGSDSVVPASDLVPWDGSGPRVYAGSFEEARAEAFRTGRLLVAAVHSHSKSHTKDDYMQALALASEEVVCLLDGNAVFWSGPASSLRGTHLQQLAPQHVPSLSVILPLAVDAMRVLCHVPEGGSETVVNCFVEALDQLEEHRAATAARLVSDFTLLRQAQDQEFAESLAADRLRPNATIKNRSEQDLEPVASASLAGSHVDAEAGTSDEQLNKRRRLLVDEFLGESATPEQSSSACLVLRLPGGQRVQRTFSAFDPLSKVRRWAQCCQWLPEASGKDFSIPSEFGLSLAYPRQVLTEAMDDRSLGDLGLTPNAALMLIDETS